MRRGNTLARPLRSYGPADHVDVILTNPPFGGVEEPGVEQNFPADIRTRETADLFLVLLLRLLKPGGRAGIVLPDASLYGDGVKTRIKEMLLDQCNLHTIVRVPASAFAPYTNIATNLLFFTKGEPTKEVWYYEHQIPADLKNYSKTKPISINEFGPEREWWTNRCETPQAWLVGVEELRDRRFDLDAKNPNAPAELDLSPAELLEAYRRKRSAVREAANELKVFLMEALEGK